MSKTTPTPKEFQIAGTRDLGIFTSNCLFTKRPIIAVHEVAVARGTDSVRRALQCAGYAMQRGYMQDGAQFFVWSKIFKAGTPLFAAALAGLESPDLATAEQMSFPRADFQMLLRSDDFYNAPVFDMPGDAYSEVR
jgi:hypothetical protein